MSIKPTLLTVVLSNVWFQALWLCAALLQDQALLPMLLLLALYGRFSGLGRAQWRVAAAVAAIGFSVDTVLTQLGVMRFNSHLGPLTPWLALLWLGLGLCLFQGLHWLGQLQPIWQALLGAAAGAASYSAAAALEALFFTREGYQSPLIIGAIWALLLPGLLYFHQRWCKRFGHPC